MLISTPSDDDSGIENPRVGGSIPSLGTEISASKEPDPDGEAAGPSRPETAPGRRGGNHRHYSAAVCVACARGAHELCTDLVTCACSQAPWSERCEAEKVLDGYRWHWESTDATLRACGVPEELIARSGPARRGVPRPGVRVHTIDEDTAAERGTPLEVAAGKERVG